MRRPVPVLALGIVAAALACASPAHAGSIPWCGSGEPTADVADAVSAFEWHLVYAMPSDGVDRFGSYAPRLAGDVATLSNWWLAQDSTRRPRFDLVDAPGCPSEPYGRVDISLLRLPRASAAYSFRELVLDVVAAGFVSPDKAYLVYYDGTLHPGVEYGVCGQGGMSSRALAYALVYLQSCGQSLSDDVRVTVAAHEMIHGLGAVPDSAPHICESGHVCDSPSDLMKPSLAYGDNLGRMSLDVGRDDYYGHGGGWWDVQDSKLLYRLDAALDPAPEIANLTATNVGSLVRAQWSAATSQPGVRYRVYDEQGRLVRDEASATIVADSAVGETLAWTVRSVNDGGFLSRPATLRFKVGYGVVDAAGVLLRDTVAPEQPSGLRATRSGSQVVLRWAAVTDLLGLRGFRISGPRLKTIVVPGTSVRLALAQARGKTLSVEAVDQAGNTGPPATVRIPR
jgi:hypothetical protein